MNIVVPYTRLHPITELVMSEYRDVRFVYLTESDSYRKLLKQIWDDAETTVIVEHDIVPWHGALDELYHCMGQWCSCSYRLFGGYGVYHGFGCTKFSAALMNKTRGIWNEATSWDVLDQRLFHAAAAIGQEPHPHRPPVIHLNPRDWR